ncbi:RNA-binding protein Musashi homolog Rbp6 [Geodia barretti]|nr:RNA-binding protein Musashi homolog Rbp6 [Geodia barretti]
MLKEDRDTGKSRGFAFIIFKEKESVEKVLEGGKHTLDNRDIDVKKAIPHAQHQAMKNRTKKIFVGGVPTDMEQITIESYFKEYGEIVEVAIVTDKSADKRRRGFVFVTYTTEEAVDRVTQVQFHSIGETKVEVKRATPREQFPGGGGGGGGGWRGGRGRGGMGGGFQRGGGGGGGGGYGRAGWVPYGYHGHQQEQYYDGSWDGGYDGYGAGGGYGGYGGYGPPQGGGRGGYSRYGPVKNYNQHGGASYHPYSR